MIFAESASSRLRGGGDHVTPGEAGVLREEAEVGEREGRRRRKLRRNTGSDFCVVW